MPVFICLIHSLTSLFQRWLCCAFPYANLWIPFSYSMQVLKFKDELMELLKLLHAKTFSKRGYSWSGKLLSSTLLTLTHTYPLENKFANPEEWDSDGGSHHSFYIVNALTL